MDARIVQFLEQAFAKRGRIDRDELRQVAQRFGLGRPEQHKLRLLPAGQVSRQQVEQHLGEGGVEDALRAIV